MPKELDMMIPEMKRIISEQVAYCTLKPEEFLEEIIELSKSLNFMNYLLFLTRFFLKRVL